MRAAIYGDAMPRFLFHLHECGIVTEDVEGVDLPDRDHAARYAVRSGRAIMADEALGGRICLSCHIEMVEVATGTRTVMRFADMVHVTA